MFRDEGGTWIEEQKLLASDAEERDLFGLTVSVSCDLALVGALYDDDSGNSSGSAYLYHYDGASWKEEVKITPTDAMEYHYFGESVELSGTIALIGATPAANRLRDRRRSTQNTTISAKPLEDLCKSS